MRSKEFITKLPSSLWSLEKKHDKKQGPLIKDFFANHGYSVTSGPHGYMIHSKNGTSLELIKYAQGRVIAANRVHDKSGAPDKKLVHEILKKHGKITSKPGNETALTIEYKNGNQVLEILKDIDSLNTQESETDWGNMSKREFKRAELQHELGHEDEWERQRRAQQKPVLQHYMFFDVPADKEADATLIGMKQTKSGKWYIGVYNTSGKTTQDKIDTATLMFGTGKKWAPKPKNEAVDITTGKEQPKTVMGFNVQSKQDKIDAKKSQIELAKRNAPKSGLTTKDLPRLEKQLAKLMKEDIHLQHNLDPGTYKHITNDIIVTINDDGSVDFMQPAEWEIEGDQEYLEYVQDMLNEPSYWTTDLNEDKNPCWDEYAPGAQSGVKTKPGTGKNKGKRVPNCEPVNAKKK